MRNASTYNNKAYRAINLNFPKSTIIGLFLIVALFAFEIFNFDTTRYALHNLMGEVSFLGLRWAGILAVAFCAIDFAGLARLFTPEQGREEPNAVWYLMGAWLLGATMNALMTWWAISLTLLSHDFGNEVLSREQLLQVVPIFVATLVWLTRILFIGAFSVAGEYIFALDRLPKRARDQQQSTRPPLRPAAAPGLKRAGSTETAVPHPQPARQPSPNPRQTRIHRRPPMPPRTTNVPAGMHARGRHR